MCILKTIQKSAGGRKQNGKVIKLVNDARHKVQKLIGLARGYNKSIRHQKSVSLMKVFSRLRWFSPTKLLIGVSRERDLQSRRQPGHNTFKTKGFFS